MMAMKSYLSIPLNGFRIKPPEEEHDYFEDFAFNSIEWIQEDPRVESMV